MSFDDPQLFVPLDVTPRVLFDFYSAEGEAAWLFEQRWKAIGLWTGSSLRLVLDEAIDLARAEFPRGARTIMRLEGLLLEVNANKLPHLRTGVCAPSRFAGLRSRLFTHSALVRVSTPGAEAKAEVDHIVTNAASLEIVDPYVLTPTNLELLEDWLGGVAFNLRKLTLKAVDGCGGRRKRGRRRRKNVQGAESSPIGGLPQRSTDEAVSVEGKESAVRARNWLEARFPGVDVDIWVYPRGAFHDRFLVAVVGGSPFGLALGGGISKLLGDSRYGEAGAKRRHAEQVTTVARVGAEAIALVRAQLARCEKALGPAFRAEKP